MSGSRRTLEANITCPILDILNSTSGKTLNTSALKAALKARLTLSSGDLMPLAGRTDYKIDQIIRNIVSHKKTASNIIGSGLITYIRRGGNKGGDLTIQPAGQAHLKANCP